MCLPIGKTLENTQNTNSFCLLFCCHHISLYDLNIIGLWIWLVLNLVWYLLINHEFSRDSFWLGMDSECVDPISTGTRLNGHIFEGKQSYQIWREAGSFLNKHSQQVPSATQYFFFTFWSGRKQMDFRLSPKKAIHDKRIWCVQQPETKRKITYYA